MAKSISLILLIAVIFLLASCGEDPDKFYPEKIIEIKVYDFDNNGNASDIRVDFEVTDNKSVQEYRVLIIPLPSINDFDKEVAASIPETNFVRVTPERTSFDYSIKRLPSTLLDVFGDRIENYQESIPIVDPHGNYPPFNLEYVIAVLVIGSDFTQISYAQPLKLLNQGIYSGMYDVAFGDPPVFGDNSINIEEKEGKYFWVRQYYLDELHEPDTIYLSISGSTITNYVCNSYRLICTDIPCFQLDTCIMSEQGIGKVIDDFLMEISVTRETCNVVTEYKEWYRRK